MDKPLLEIKGISKSFIRSVRRREEEVYKLLDNIDLNIFSGKITALVGGNGTGKTTLFNIISGFETADKGEIIYYNHSGRIRLLKYPDYSRARLKIGRLFQEGHIFPNLTVLENLMISKVEYIDEKVWKAAFDHTSKKKETHTTEEVTKVLNKFFTTDHKFFGYLDKPASKLSGGEQRILGLLRLFISDYQLIMLDEPTASVDKENLDTIEEIIRKMVKENGNAIFLIEHNLEFVKRMADSCAFIHDKQIALNDDPGVVFNHPMFREHYFDSDNYSANNHELSNSQNDIILELQGFGFNYINNDLLQKNIDLQLRYGDRLLIVGPNGSGKSSMVKAIIGDDKLEKTGKVIYCGQDITNKSLREIMMLGISYFSQGGRIYPHLTVKENLVMAGNKLPRKEFLNKEEELSAYIPILLSHAKREASYLSGGERNLLALAMALINSPELLILDEPVAGLSAKNAEILYDTLEKLNERFKFTLVLIEHNIKNAISFANREFRMDNIKNNKTT